LNSLDELKLSHTKIEVLEGVQGLLNLRGIDVEYIFLQLKI